MGGGGVTKIQYRGGNCLKRGAWKVCRFKGGLGKKVGGCVFKGGTVDTPVHTMAFEIHSFLDLHQQKKEKRKMDLRFLSSVSRLQFFLLRRAFRIFF